MFGPPEDVSVTRPPIWKYGDLEFSFHQGRVCLVVLHARNSEKTVRQLQHLLDERSIPHHVDPVLTFDTQTAINTSTGASVVFDGDGTLHSVSIA